MNNSSSTDKHGGFMDKIDMIWASLSGCVVIGISLVISLFTKINKIDRDLSDKVSSSELKTKLDEVKFESYKAQMEKRIGDFATKQDLRDLKDDIIHTMDKNFEHIITLLEANVSKRKN